MSRKDLAFVLIRVLALWFAGNWVIWTWSSVQQFFATSQSLRTEVWGESSWPYLLQSVLGSLSHLVIAVGLWAFTGVIAELVARPTAKPPKQPDAYAGSLSSLTDDDV
ncbi:MAG: hypothetical protein AAF612_08025 [Planctomycetota bacterium]